jgi:hypothetical protein
MHQKTVAKLAGFVIAAGTTAALIGFAANGTGAYFSDTQTGIINAGTGTIKVSVTSPAGGTLNFDNLIPGEYQNQSVTYQANTTDNVNGEDIWLVFPTDGSAEAFEGYPGDGPGGVGGGGLGRYGHFAVTSVNNPPSAGAASFSSYNLSREGLVNPHLGPVCKVDDNGEGGQSTGATSTSSQVDFCAPNAILLAIGLTNGQYGTATMTFGFTPLLSNTDGNGKNFQGAASALLVKYQIVATQHGIKPGDPLNTP